MDEAQIHFQRGDLNTAITVMGEILRSAPSDTRKRAFFAELLCLAGQWDRADRQLETLLSLDSNLGLTVGTWRQLIRAAQARQDVFEQGAAPSLTGEANALVEALLALQLALRHEDWPQAAACSEQAESLRAACPGTINGKPVADMRDLDDSLNGVLEVLTTHGRYFWVTLDQLESLQLEPPTRPLDLLWRKARMLLRDGTDGEVFIPATYPLPTDDGELRMGRRTEWVDDHGIIRGQGQRMWLSGEDAQSWQDIERIQPDMASVAA